MVSAGMEDILRDDWDRHWVDISAVSQHGPALKYRMRLILDLLDIKAKAQLVDIGSGVGDFAAAFRQRYSLVDFVGLEMSGAGVEIASRKAPWARFLQRDLLAPPTSDDTCGVRGTHAVCSEVLEHVDEPERLLRNASAYLAPGCRLVVTVPGGPITAFDRHIGHRRHYTPRELGWLLESAGYRVERLMGAGFPFFNLYRIGVALRGHRLINDVSVSAAEKAPLHVRAGFLLFNPLFRCNLPFWGWQTVAVARWPGPSA
jgi:SAM-dependent methyltransferase